MWEIVGGFWVKCCKRKLRGKVQRGERVTKQSLTRWLPIWAASISDDSKSVTHFTLSRGKSCPVFLSLCAVDSGLLYTYNTGTGTRMIPVLGSQLCAVCGWCLPVLNDTLNVLSITHPNDTRAG